MGFGSGLYHGPAARHTRLAALRRGGLALGLRRTGLCLLRQPQHPVRRQGERPWNRAADSAGILDRNFGNFTEYFLSRGPLISKQLVDVVKLTRSWGLESKAVADFVKDQVANTILPGLEAFTK